MIFSSFSQKPQYAADACFPADSAAHKASGVKKEKHGNTEHADVKKKIVVIDVRPVIRKPETAAN